MKSFRVALRRVAGLFARRCRDAEFAAELESHLELHTDDGIRSGLTPAEARRQALLKLGGVEATRETYRDRAGLPLADSIAKDIRFAVRSLLKTPVVTFVAVLSLALGIGGNTAVFSVTNALLLRSLPVHDPDQLVSIYTIHPEDPSEKDPLSLPMLEAFGRSRQVFSAMFGWSGGNLTTFESDNREFPGILTAVTGDYFTVLGVKPLLGRPIQPSDVALHAGASSPVAVLGYRFWTVRFNADPAILGKTIQLDGQALTIIGVMPASFTGLIVDRGEDVTVPLGATGDTSFRERRSLRMGVYGRLKPGVSLRQARAQVQAIWPSVQRATEPEGYTGERLARFYSRRIDVESAARGWSSLRNRLSKPLTILMALLGLVLLVACVNLAGVMLARAAGRRHELAVRMALGAGAWRLARQLLTESLLLSATGAAIGFAIAFPAGRLLMAAMWSYPLPLVLDAAPDLRVLAFTAAVALSTAILFGFAPAWRAVRTDPADALRQNGRTVRGGGQKSGKVLVVAQVALSLVVVFSATLLVRSLANLETVNPGFERKGVLAMLLMSQPARQILGDGRGAYYRELTERIERLPGVVSAGFSVMGPVNRAESKDPVVAEGSHAAPEQAAGDVVGPGFFRMIGMHVLAGREFEWRDDDKTPPVVVISQSLANSLFPGGDAVGRYIVEDPGVNQRRLQVIGVVNSASLWRIQHREPRAVYFPLLQEGPTGSYLAIRTAVDPYSIAPVAAKVVEAMGHEYALNMQTLDDRMNQMTSDEHMLAWLAAFFGGVAMLLAAIGLYGLLSDSVAQRRPEIGIRMALGAERGNVTRLVLKEALMLVGAGTAIGIPAALAVSRSIATMLFGITPTDPQTIAAAAAALLAVAVFAGYLPARQASRVDPMATLRSD
jgi:predicted permease